MKIPMILLQHVGRIECSRCGRVREDYVAHCVCEPYNGLVVAQPKSQCVTCQEGCSDNCKKLSTIEESLRETITKALICAKQHQHAVGSPEEVAMQSQIGLRTVVLILEAAEEHK